MSTTTKTIATLAAGALLLAAGTAQAGVAVSFGLNLGGRVRPGAVVVTRPVAVAQTSPVSVSLLPNNYTASALTGHAGMGRYFRVHVPAGQSYLNVLTDGGWGESDLYVARGFLPTPTNHHYASVQVGTHEQVSVVYPTPGDWYVLVYGAGSYGDVSLLASHWQQEVYQDAGTVYVHPTTWANRQVCLTWGHSSSRRPVGGWISFVLNSLRRHHKVHHRPVARRSTRTVAVRPRVQRVLPVVARQPARRPQATLRRTPVATARPTMGTSRTRATRRTPVATARPTINTSRTRATRSTPVATARPTMGTSRTRATREARDRSSRGGRR